MITFLLGAYCVATYTMGGALFGMSEPSLRRVLVWLLSPVTVPVWIVVLAIILG